MINGVITSLIMIAIATRACLLALTSLISYACQGNQRSYSHRFPPLQNQASDSALIARFQAGESGVFDLLYRRHRDRIHGVILSVVCHPDDALDLTQEVFLKAYQRLDTFKQASQFYSWLYRIAVNQCIDFMRRQSKHHVLIDEPFCEETFRYTQPPPTAALERDEFHCQLDAALPTLTPCQRRVFILHYKEDLSLKTIAHRLGRSIGTAKAHLFHARRTLRLQLKDFYRPPYSVG